MQFRDLHAQYERLKPRIDSAIAAVLESGQFIGGPKVSKLESALAKYVGARNCITCANGTDALQLALMVWGIGPGDAVIVPDFTFFSSGEVVSAVGATPVFVNVNPDTFNIDPDHIQPGIDAARKASLNPKVVVAVDLFGLPADYAAIREICDKNDMLILEDGAQGFGGSIEGKMACSFGDISTTSFFPAKPLGCYGDGGAIFTDNDEWAQLIRSYAVHGKGSMKYDNVRVGMNSRLDSIQAAILQVKLEEFERYEVDAVNAVAETYDEALAGTSLQLPDDPSGYRSSWAQYTVRLPEDVNREELQTSLKEQGIPTMIYYPKPMHEQTAFEGNCIYVDGGYPTRDLCDSVLSLPCGPYLDKQDVLKVADAVKAF